MIGTVILSSAHQSVASQFLPMNIFQKQKKIDKNRTIVNYDRTIKPINVSESAENQFSLLSYWSYLKGIVQVVHWGNVLV